MKRALGGFVVGSIVTAAALTPWLTSRGDSPSQARVSRHSNPTPRERQLARHAAEPASPSYSSRNQAQNEPESASELEAPHAIQISTQTRSDEFERLGSLLDKRKWTAAAPLVERLRQDEGIVFPRALALRLAPAFAHDRQHGAGGGSVALAMFLTWPTSALESAVAEILAGTDEDPSQLANLLSPISTALSDRTFDAGELPSRLLERADVFSAAAALRLAATSDPPQLDLLGKTALEHRLPFIRAEAVMWLNRKAAAGNANAATRAGEVGLAILEARVVPRMVREAALGALHYAGEPGALAAERELSSGGAGYWELRKIVSSLLRQGRERTMVAAARSNRSALLVIAELSFPESGARREHVEAIWPHVPSLLRDVEEFGSIGRMTQVLVGLDLAPRIEQLIRDPSISGEARGELLEQLQSISSERSRAVRLASSLLLEHQSRTAITAQLARSALDTVASSAREDPEFLVRAREVLEGVSHSHPSAWVRSDALDLLKRLPPGKEARWEAGPARLQPDTR